MEISTFDANYSYNSTLGMSSNWSTISTAVGNINLYEAYANNLNSSGSSNNDQDTGFVNAFTNLLGSGAGALPTLAGTGVGTGSTPQDILFIITDGMRDESISGSRTMGGIDTSYCTMSKIAASRSPYSTRNICLQLHLTVGRSVMCCRSFRRQTLSPQPLRHVPHPG